MPRRRILAKAIESFLEPYKNANLKEACLPGFF
jgi:hypothetical protein